MIGNWLGHVVGQWLGRTLGAPEQPPESMLVDGSPAWIALPFSQDDQDLLEIMPIVIEVMHRGR